MQHVAPWSGRVMRGEENISNLDIAWSVAADPTAQLVVTPVDPLRGAPVPDTCSAGG